MPTQETSLPTYPIPGRYLNGKGSSMHLWHVVYYLLATRSEKRSRRRSVITTTQELGVLSGVKMRMVRNERNKMANEPAPFKITEEEGDGGFALILSGYDEAIRPAVGNKCYEIPVGLVKNGWLPLLWSEGGSRLLIAILNQLLRLPATQQALDLDYLTRRCATPGSKSKPPRDQMLRALDHLIRLKLVDTQISQGKLWYQLQADQLRRPATSPKRAAEDLWQIQVIRSAFQQDQQRAERALRCLQTGRFEPEHHFEAAFRDLLYVNWEQENQRLLMRLAKWAGKPPSQSRWQQFWRHYCQLRKNRDSKRKQSSKLIFYFDQTGPIRGQLAYPQLERARLIYAHLIIKVSLPASDLNRETILALIGERPSGERLWEIKFDGPIRSRKQDLTPQVKAGDNWLICKLTRHQPPETGHLSLHIEAATYRR